MDQLAKDYADEAHHLFVYTRETHPEMAREHGDQPFEPFMTYEEKAERARFMRDKWASPRLTLVDALDGEVHRDYSGVPNMSWVLDHTGRVSFKASWTRIGELRPSLEAALEMRALKRAGNYLVTYVTAGISYRPFPRDLRDYEREHFGASQDSLSEGERAATQESPAAG